VTGAQYTKNYEFEYTFTHAAWGTAKVVFTSVIGHLISTDFEPRYKGWESCQPAELFEARIVNYVADVSFPLACLMVRHVDRLVKDKKAIADNIKRQARYAKTLYIWTDCDREGEHIGSEIRDLALQSNNRLEVMRAKFNNIERAYDPC